MATEKKYLLIILAVLCVIFNAMAYFPPPPCDTPDTFSLISPNGGTPFSAPYNITLQWYPSTHADGYYIYLDTNDPPTTYQDAVVGSTSWLVPNEDLLPGTTYYWRITAKTFLGCEPQEYQDSEEIFSFTTASSSSQYDLTLNITGQPTIGFTEAGEYTFKVTATNDAGSVDDYVSITITNPQNPEIPSSLAKIYAAGSKIDEGDYNGAQVYERTFELTDNGPVAIEKQWQPISEPQDFDSADAVLSLCQYQKTLFAGTKGTSGKVYKYAGKTTTGDNVWIPESDWERVLIDDAGNTESYKDDVKCVYSLAVFSESLFAGTNVRNTLFKYVGGKKWRAITVTGQTSGIRCLYVWKDKNRLYLDANKTEDGRYLDENMIWHTPDTQN